MIRFSKSFREGNQQDRHEQLSRVGQSKNCDYVGWQIHGRIVKGISWASGGLMIDD